MVTVPPTPPVSPVPPEMPAEAPFVPVAPVAPVVFSVPTVTATPERLTLPPVVVRVEPGSTADEAGLKKGDVIQEIDKKRVGGIGDFNRITSSIEPGDTTLLFVNRGGRRFYITIKGS